MSAHTLPIPVTRPRRSDHEHGWLVESRHTTSDGTVLYVRCADCGSRRVDLQSFPGAPPTAVSRVAGGRNGSVTA